MTMLERSRTLHAQIELRNVLRRAHQDATAFRERIGEVRTAREELAGEIARLMVLRNKGVNVAKPPLPTATVDLLRDVESRLASNPVDIGKDYGRLKRSVEKVRKDVNSVVDKAVNNVIRDLPSIEENFLRQAELIPAYSDKVTRIRTQRDGLLKELDVRTPQGLELFLDRRDSLRRLADTLNPEEFPKEVLEFFKAIRYGGAPLDKFTASVQDWLAERDQLKHVRVIIQR